MSRIVFRDSVEAQNIRFLDRGEFKDFPYEVIFSLQQLICTWQNIFGFKKSILEFSQNRFTLLEELMKIAKPLER